MGVEWDSSLVLQLFSEQVTNLKLLVSLKNYG